VNRKVLVPVLLLSGVVLIAVPALHMWGRSQAPLRSHGQAAGRAAWQPGAPVFVALYLKNDGRAAVQLESIAFHPAVVGMQGPLLVPARLSPTATDFYSLSPDRVIAKGYAVAAPPGFRLEPDPRAGVTITVAWPPDALGQSPFIVVRYRYLLWTYSAQFALKP
jgi:hypothetical protein